MSKMAPTCVCGHRASEHRKQMGMRTRCMWEVELTHPTAEDITAYCPCTMYKPEEEKEVE